MNTIDDKLKAKELRLKKMDNAGLRTEEAEKKARKHTEQLEMLLHERTLELKKTRKKLSEIEKCNLKSCISGEAVHEIRNLLTGIKIDLSSMQNYHGKGRTSVEQLRDCAADMVEHFFKINTANNLSEDKYIPGILPDIKQLTMISDSLSDFLQSVSENIDRGINLIEHTRQSSKPEKI